VATKILLVEDNDAILRVLAMCLQLEGLTVEQAHDGLEASQKLEDETFDVVVSDLRMPGLNGLELVGRVRDRFAGTPIVLMTADATARTMKTVNQAGVSRVLIKAFPVKELVASIRKVVPDNNV
jgi:DNA-binding response OmpR family regulator